MKKYTDETGAVFLVSKSFSDGIEIINENAEGIESMLREVNGTTRIDYSAIKWSADYAEKLLEDLRLPILYRVGAIYEFESGDDTMVCIERGTKGWCIACVKNGFETSCMRRARSHVNRLGRYLLRLTKDQDDILVENLRRSYVTRESRNGTLFE
jgi:hypothetical protein